MAADSPEPTVRWQQFCPGRQSRPQHWNEGPAIFREIAEAKRRVRWKTDWRLCTIAGLLCSLNLLDSGILSSAAVTTLLTDLGLDQGSRFSVSILIFTVTSVVFQLPCTLAVRIFGPRVWFASITFAFGLVTLCTAFVQDWRQMIATRVILGIAMSGIYPGLTYLISTWYPRHEQQLRFAFLQAGEVAVLATGNLLNYGLNHLHGKAGLAGWRWMYLVQGTITCVLGIITYWWIVDFPEKSHESFKFLTEQESRIAAEVIHSDRADVNVEPFSWMRVLNCFLDVKIYGFACMFFLLNLVSTALSYFLPIILEGGMGLTSNQAILLSVPPYYYAVIPAIVTSLAADKLRVRSPFIAFNALCIIIGFAMFGLDRSAPVAVRYIGTFLATGGYVSNWAALNAFMANNVVGQWQRAVTAATVAMFEGLGGVAGSFIVRQIEAPWYRTAVWVSIGSQALLICMVGVVSLYFSSMNKKQRGIVEHLPSFRYTL